MIQSSHSNTTYGRDNLATNKSLRVLYIQTKSCCPCVLKICVHFIMKNVLSVSMCLQSFNISSIVQKSTFKVFSEGGNKLLTLRLYKIKMTCYAYNIQVWDRGHLPIPKWKNRKPARQDQTKHGEFPIFYLHSWYPREDGIWSNVIRSKVQRSKEKPSLQPHWQLLIMASLLDWPCPLCSLTDFPHSWHL